MIQPGLKSRINVNVNQDLSPNLIYMLTIRMHFARSAHMSACKLNARIYVQWFGLTLRSHSHDESIKYIENIK